MFKIFLSINKDLEYFIIYFLFNLFKMVLKFCVMFEIVLFLFEKFLRLYSDLKVNVRDINGNILLYVLIFGMNFFECVDVVEMFINNGVDINIWCNKGYLLIDFFNIVFLLFYEFVIDRGKFFLGG